MKERVEIGIDNSVDREALRTMEDNTYEQLCLATALRQRQGMEEAGGYIR